MPFSVKQREFFDNANKRWNFKTGAKTMNPSNTIINEIIPYKEVHEAAYFTISATGVSFRFLY